MKRRVALVAELHNVVAALPYNEATFSALSLPSLKHPPTAQGLNRSTVSEKDAYNHPFNAPLPFPPLSSLHYTFGMNIAPPITKEWPLARADTCLSPFKSSR